MITGTWFGLCSLVLETVVLLGGLVDLQTALVMQFDAFSVEDFLEFGESLGVMIATSKL